MIDNDIASAMFAGYSFLAMKEAEICAALITRRAVDIAARAERLAGALHATETPGLEPSATPAGNCPQNGVYVESEAK